jgi:hypothetical protein
MFKFMHIISLLIFVVSLFLLRAYICIIKNRCLRCLLFRTSIILRSEVSNFKYVGELVGCASKFFGPNSRGSYS